MTKMSFVRTVLGDIPAEQLGVCYAHEHVVIDSGFATHNEPGFLINDVECAKMELLQFRKDGGRAMIDSMPCDCGRNVAKLATISEQTGVHLVCPTGLHLAKYYDEGHWGTRYTEDELADLFVADIVDGIDVNDYGGPLIRRTTHRAGIIKIATERTVTSREEKIFAAASQAHCRTGCPILTHTEQGELALDQIEMLRKHGVSLPHVCLSHTDRRTDVGYHREILATGVRVEFDSVFRWKPAQGNPSRDLLLSLITEFPDQVMLGMDAARRSYWKSYGGTPGLSYLLIEFTKELHSLGVSETEWQRIFVTTPASTFSFAGSSTHHINE